MKACEAEVDKSHAKSCTAVIMQPKTGDILAMAQWPTWDQNTDVSDPTDIPDQWQFTPGSTAKVITAAAAFEHGGKTPMSSYYIPYQIYRGGQWIHDAEWSPNEHYTVAGIIANSSNIGMSQVVQSVSQQTQYDYLRNFGLDEPTGLGLPGEATGELDPPSKWALDERYTLAYGQGITVNAIQMASVYATIANNGVRVTPRLVEGTYNAAGQYTPAPASKSRQVIQPKTAKELIPILQQVPGVDETANQPWGIIPGYAVASKTGTANEPASSVEGASCPAGNPLCIYGASYIGMAPGNSPQVVVAVNVQDPNKSNQDYFGDMVAGPVFYNVMENAIAELGIQPQPGLVPPDVRLNAP
jgi:cell division protein FtsI (penicillin-binding protein 3)